MKTKNLGTYLIASIVFIFGIGYFTYLNSHTQQLSRLTKENNTYHRTTTCILSVPLVTRTESYISGCYNKAEQANGIKVDRFGNK